MPSTLAPGFLVDAYGRPIAPRGGSGNLHRRTREDDFKRPPPPNHYADYAALLSPHRYRTLVSESRYTASRGLVSALIESKKGYVSASGWRPRFEGADAGWGRLAQEWLEEHLKIANIRGPRFGWAQSWALSTRCHADSGGFFVLLTAWPDTQLGAVQFIEAHRIGQRDDGNCIVGPTDALTVITAEDGASRTIRGAYRGLRIHNGIITNPAGTEVAARILGATPDEDQDVSLRDLIFVAAPSSYSESRPVPVLASSLLDWLAVDLAQTAQLDQQIADARRDIIEETPSGLPPTGAIDTGVELTPAGTKTDVVERGMYRFIQSGNKLTAFQSQRPSDQWMNFDLRVVKRAARSVRWAWEMLDPEALRGGATRALQDQVNTYILEDFHATAPAAVRVVQYFIAKAIKAGDLPASAEWRRWSIAQPPAFEVDRASARIDLEEVAAGRVAMSTLVARDGSTMAEVYRQRAADYRLAEQIAAETSVPVEVIRGASPSPASSAPPPAPAPSNERDNLQLLPSR